MIRTEHEEIFTQEQQFLVFPLIVSVLVSLALILVLVWMNTARLQLSYELRKEQAKLDKVEEVYASLSVEREEFLSPQWLGQQASKMGLIPAKPGQVRRMTTQEHAQER